MRVQPEGRTVEPNFWLDIYTFFHSRAYDSFRLLYPDQGGDEVVAHLHLPHGDDRRPVVVVFPILGGAHVVSEALAKVLVNRGYAVLRLERRPLELASANDARVVADALRGAVVDARRLLDWAVAHPRLDPGRIAAAGVSLGSKQALLLLANDARVRGGFFAMTGGQLAEILYDSAEKPVRIFRERLIREQGLDTREAFVSALRTHTLAVDPLTYAGRIDPDTVLLASGRFDRVVRPEHTEALWEGMGRPRWIRFPAGHYQFFPFFYWVAARGADHLDQLLPE